MIGNSNHTEMPLNRASRELIVSPIRLERPVSCRVLSFVTQLTSRPCAVAHVATLRYSLPPTYTLPDLLAAAPSARNIAAIISPTNTHCHPSRKRKGLRRSSETVF